MANKLYEYEYYLNKLKEHYDKVKEENIDNEKILKEVDERYYHSLGVVDKTVEIILSYHLPIDIEKAKIAAILHDYAKFTTLEEYEYYADKYQVRELLNEKSFKVLHALLGRYQVQDDLGIDDEEILGAIEFHTTGKGDMSLLEEVLYIADCVEEGRTDPYFTSIRKLAKRNYRKAIAIVLRDTIERIAKESKYLHPYTMEAYVFYKKYLVSGEVKYERVLSALDHNLLVDVRVYDSSNYSPMYDVIIVSTCTSQRAMEACISYLRDEFDIRGVEIGDSWTLIDLDDIILHIFKKEDRENYALDRIYAKLPLLYEE